MIEDKSLILWKALKAALIVSLAASIYMTIMFYIIKFFHYLLGELGVPVGIVIIMFLTTFIGYVVIGYFNNEGK